MDMAWLEVKVVCDVVTYHGIGVVLSCWASIWGHNEGSEFMQKERWWTILGSGWEVERQ